LNISAESLNSSILASERNRILSSLRLSPPSIRLLYITPECLNSSSFRPILQHLSKRGYLNRIVVDECHCVSQFGHDFRPAYLEIGRIKNEFGIGCTALTATATPKVKRDIIEHLGLIDTREFVFSSVRDRLVYSIQDKPDSPDAAYDLVLKYINNKQYCVGIVFCATRAECDDMQDRLMSDGIAVCVYHAGMTKSDRKKVIDAWMGGGKGPVICIATSCFGMGIDRPDVDFVLHYSLPKDISAYHQVSLVF
jgi:RecQ family ATP-dependent DNA helicase